MSVNLRGVDLNLLVVFDAIMAEGKLSAAAEKLGMTQSAASSALGRLRDTFDHELFIRTRQGMTPTSRAQELIGPIREALSSIQQAFEPNEPFDPSSSTRTFRLVLGDYGELTLLPVLLQILEAGGDDLSVRTFSDRDPANLDRVAKAQIDLLFDYRKPEHGNLRFTKLTDVELVVIARKRHPRLRSELTRKEFLAERHIVYTSHQTQFTALERIFESKTRIPRKVMAEVMQISSVPRLVEQTDAIATMPRDVAAYYATSHKIRLFPFPLKQRKVPAYMIWHKTLDGDEGHRWLRDTLDELIKGQPDPG
ncbi:MAG: LysR substrate-binding domain-containing protein [Polyangiales bacterium]